MKKLTAMLLALTLCFGLAACGGNTAQDDTKDESQTVQTGKTEDKKDEAKTKEKSDETKTEDAKTETKTDDKTSTDSKTEDKTNETKPVTSSTNTTTAKPSASAGTSKPSASTSKPAASAPASKPFIPIKRAVRRLSKRFNKLAVSNRRYGFMFRRGGQWPPFFAFCRGKIKGQTGGLPYGR